MIDKSCTDPPWMAVVPRSSDVSAVPKLVVKTIHGRIVLTGEPMPWFYHIFGTKLPINYRIFHVEYDYDSKYHSL
ncbi:MAG: hypothetical protein ACTTH8_08785 [Treponema sp.]